MLFRFEPIQKKVIWGDSKFFGNFNINEPNIGELWVLGSNNIIVGKDGITLDEYAKKNPYCLYGKGIIPPRFPVLIKYISTSEWLSVQLHPNDEFAKTFENEPWGKTEMWFFLSAKNDSQIICGLREKVPKEEIYKLINSNSLTKILNYINIKENEWILVKSGVVHAIGPNISLLEIQMNSELTYRLYDWGRVDHDDKPRELHIEKGLKAIDYSENLKLVKGLKEVNLQFPTFEVKTIKIPEVGEIKLDTEGKTFHIIVSIESDIVLNNELLRKYECILVTANEGKYKIKGSKNCNIFLIRKKEE